MEIYTSREAFGFLRDVIDSKTRPTSLNKLAVIFLQRITNPLFISFDMFALVVPYCFSV